MLSGLVNQLWGVKGKGRAKNGEDREVVNYNDEHYEDTSRSHDFCCERIRRPAILNWRSVRDGGEAFQLSIHSVVISSTCEISWRTQLQKCGNTNYSSSNFAWKKTVPRINLTCCSSKTCSKKDINGPLIYCQVWGLFFSTCPQHCPGPCACCGPCESLLLHGCSPSCHCIEVYIGDG